MTDNIPGTKTKNETMSRHLNNANVQENNSVPLLELDTINTSPINFNSDKKTGLSDANEYFTKIQKYKNTDENNQPKSPSMLSITPYRRKRRRQSRLAFYPVKNNEKMELSSSVDKHKAANILHTVEQNFIQDVSIANATTNATVTENSATTLVNNTSEISDEDEVIEASPTQRSVASKVRQFLELKKEIAKKRIDFGSCPSPKHTSMQMENVNTLKDKVNITYLSSIEMHETFYLPAEQTANRNKMDNFNLDDTENKPPEKKKLLNKFNV